MTPCSCLKFAEPNTCAACRYGVCPGCSYPNEIMCRRHAPVAIPDDQRGSTWKGWPQVWRGYWCGDFEPRAVAFPTETQAKHAHEWEHWVTMDMNPPIQTARCRCGATYREQAGEIVIVEAVKPASPEDRTP